MMMIRIYRGDIFFFGSVLQKYAACLTIGIPAATVFELNPSAFGLRVLSAR